MFTCYRKLKNIFHLQLKNFERQILKKIAFVIIFYILEKSIRNFSTATNNNNKRNKNNKNWIKESNLPVQI